jgi:hypothetical protein
LIVLPVFCAALCLVLRRFGVSPQAAAPAEAPPEPTAEVSNPLRNLPLPLSDLAAGPAEQFDLGPTYAEERRLQEEAARQQEAAVLMRIYEQNVRLREEIGQPAAAEGGLGSQAKGG